MIKLIGEIGINHNGNTQTAKDLISFADLAGFNYVKLQKRNPDICVPENKKSIIKSTPWGDMTYLEYKKKIEFGFDEYSELFDFSKNKKIELFASVWDLDSARLMKQFTNIVKIPSALICDDKLLIYCRKNYETLLMSTGMSTEEEVENAVKVGEPDVIFHTNSCYPSKIDDLNLNYIKWLLEKYPLSDIGYSGHEFGLTTTFATASMGITWLERHITLDHSMWGSDQKSSVDIVGMAKLTRGIRDIERAMGVYGERILAGSEEKKKEDLRK